MNYQTNDTKTRHSSRKKSDATSANALEQFDLKEFLSLIKRNLLLLLALVTVVSAGVMIQHVMFPMYRAKSNLWVQTSQNSLSQAILTQIQGTSKVTEIKQEIPEKFLELLDSLDFFIATSEDLLHEPSFQEFKKYIPKNTDGRYSDAEAMATVLSSWTHFDKVGENRVQILVDAKSPQLSLYLANWLAEAARKHITQKESQEIDEASNYLQTQISELEAGLRNTDKTIVNFKASNQVASIDAASEASASRSFDLKKSLNEVNVEIEQNNQLLNQLTAQLNQRGDEKDIVTSNRFGNSRKIAELRRENEYLYARKRSIEKVMDKYFKSQNPHIEQQVLDLRKKIELEYSLYNELKKTLFQLDLQRIFLKNRVILWEKAKIFEVGPSKTLSKKLTFAVLVTLLMGIMFLYVVEILVPKVKNLKDLQSMEMFLLGFVPELKAKRPQFKLYRKAFKEKINRWKDEVTDYVIHDSKTTLAIKQIQVKLHHLGLARKSSTGFVITCLSPQVGDGKSFMSAQLALAFAEDNKKVLLIDADIRKRSITEKYETKENKNSIGFSDVVLKQAKLSEAIQKTDIEGLSVMTAGAITSIKTEKYTDADFKNLLQELRGVYDYIIIDSPPVLIVTDGALIASNADFTLVVAKANYTSIENTEIALDVLQQFKVKSICSVLNRQQGSWVSATNYGNYYYVNKSIN